MKALAIWAMLFSFTGSCELFGTQTETHDSTTWFRELNLPPMILDQLHVELDEAQSRFAVRAAAERLIDEYCRQLLAGQPSQVEFPWNAVRMQQVADAWPDLDSPLWRLSILAARLQAAEKLYADWMIRRADKIGQIMLENEWKLILQSALAIEDEINTTGAIETSTGYTESEFSNLRFRLTILISRAATSLIEISDPDVATSEIAIRNLHKLLGLADSLSSSVNEFDLIEISRGWQVRSAEDLAVCLAKSGRPEWIAKITDSIGTQLGPVDKFVSEARIRGRCGQLTDLRSLTDRFLKASPELRSGSSSEVGQFWFAVLWSAITAEKKADPNCQILIDRSLAELAFLDTVLLTQALDQLTVSGMPPVSDGFLALWTEGAKSLGQYQLLKVRMDSGISGSLPTWLRPDNKTADVDVQRVATELLIQARDLLRQALQHSGGVPQKYSGCCELLLGEAARLSGDWDEAHRAARQAVQQLAQIHPESAARASTVQLESIRQLMNADALSETEAISELLGIQTLFPGTAVSNAAGFQIALLETRSLPPAESVARWLDILDKNPEDFPANRELFEQLASLVDSAPKSERSGRLEQLVRQGIRITNISGLPATNKIRFCSTLVYYLGQYPNDFPETSINPLIDRLNILAGEPGLDPEFRGEAMYAIMKFSIASGRPALRREAIDWLASHPETGNWHKAALLEWAHDFEPLFATPHAAPEFPAAAREVYSLLVAAEGQDSNSLRDNPNARLSLTRLARLNSMAGNYDEALKQFLQVLTVFPNDREVLLEAARLAPNRLPEDEQADLWRRLGKLASAGTEVWRESRYNLILKLKASNPESAEAVRFQTLQLDPDMPEDWRQKIQGK